MANPSNGHDPASRIPLAIVGIGCRFPGGAVDPESFWNLMLSGTDAVTEVPESRWNVKNFYHPDQGIPGKTYSRWGGFVEGIDRFEPEFFGIAPREAPFMDPQQRMLLEVAWESIEDAGDVPERLGGTRTGVFVGVSHMDYAQIQASPFDLSSIDAHTATGGAASIAPARVSYCLNLKGPSMAVDTACSSSLVAVHLACRSIWSGESEQALAGGVNAIITPAPYIGFCAASMLSPEGRCKAFAAGADGFVRGEGAGLVLIKPLDRALAEGNPVYALITGTAINQDGRTTGIASPGKEAQIQLLRDVCRDAGVSPAAVAFVEAHGTGTGVGDPVEAGALGTVLSEDRDPARPCLLGSVKTNIGHLESAAGVAGLIKAALSLQHRVLPPNLHFHEPNPDIPFETLRLRVPVEPAALGDGALHAGVNSFGFGGTNAHVLLRDFRPEPGTFSAPVSTNGHEVRPRVLLLSSRTQGGVAGEAARYRAFLGEKPDVSLDDVCYTLRTRRTRLDETLAVAFGNREDLLDRLDAHGRGERRAGMVASRRAPNRKPKLAFVYPGQGPQWWGMARRLFETDARFREILERCDALVCTRDGWSLLEEMGRDETTSRLKETSIGQPAIAAVQAGLTAVLADRGIRPDAVVGHSVGEIAAAHAAGILSLESMMQLVVTRGASMDRPTSRGGMLAAALSPAEAEATIAGYAGSVVVAAHNAPSSVTLSGDPEALAAIAADLEIRGVFCKSLPVDYAFHSPRMDAARESFLADLAGFLPETERIPMISTVTGEPAPGEAFTLEYWWDNVRNRVRFTDAVDWFLKNEFDSFVEIGPHPVLAGPLAETYLSRGKRANVFPTLRRDGDDDTVLLATLGALHGAGFSVPWPDHAPGGKTVRLPRRAWQHESYWNETATYTTVRSVVEHPLLGRMYPGAEPTWANPINKRVLRYLDDHRVQDKVVVPASAFVEMALAAGRRAFGESDSLLLEDLQFQRFLFLPDSLETPQIQLTLNVEEHMFSIHSRAGGDDDAWVQHAIGGVRTGGGPAPGIAFDPEAVRARATNHITPEEFYNQRSAHAVHHGPAFQGIEALWRRDGESLGRLRLPEVCWENAADYAVHPALLDACFQVAPMAVYESAVGDDRPTIVPVGASRIRYYHRPANELWVHARLTRSSPDVIEGDLSVIDETGVALEVEGFRYQTIENRNAGADTVSRWLYRDRWVSRPLAGSPAPASPPAFLPPGSEILRDAGELVRLRAAIDDIPEASRALSATALRAVAAAFVRLGFSSRPGDPVTASGLCAELGIVERYHRLTARFLAALAGAGVLEKTGDGYRVLRPLDDLDPAPTFREILEAFPSHQSILTLVGRCGDRLDAILAGTTDPIEALFPDGATSAVEQFYQDSPEFRAYNTAVGLAIERAVRDLPQDRPLRILEVGAGTGGLTAHVLPGLPAERTHYVFSDVSVAFFSGAQQKFRNFPFVEYKPLDVERAPADQGFGEHEFDIILASDVLHATRNLRHALGNLKRLLAPEGLLLFLEAESTAPWVDVVFGVTEGWWRFEDADLRPDYPLLSGPAWHALLEDEGFRDITRLCAEPGGAPSAQVVLWARGPTVETPSSQAPSPPAAAGPWLVFADRGGVGEALAARLRGQGEPCFTVTAGPGFRRSGDAFVTDPLDPGAMNLLVAALRESGHTPTQVVHLWSLDGGPAGETTPDSLIRDETAGCHTVLELVQAAALGGGIAPPRLTLVTRFAQPLGTRGAGGFSQAGLLGLGRTIANEIPDVGCTLVDLDDADPETAAGLVLAELVASDGDREVAYRSGHRFVPRIGEAGPPLAICRRVDDAPAEPAYRLTLPRPGVLDHLELAEIERRAPGENQVEIAVEAASLNFRDVLKALGLYPTDGGDHRIVGDECAGRVVRVGEGAPFRVGDPVIAVGPACLGSHVTTHAALVVRKPEALTFEEAATVPIAFMTAYYALVHLGRLQFGERVLIHSGAGGVGMAAVQIARHLGAVVYATAGTREKRALLRSLGVEHVMDSRSLTFHEEVMRLTDKRGVDVVLNSLAGQALVKGVACLAPYGRFLELGKRDIYQNSRIGLWSFRKNLSFHAVDLAGITLDRLEEARTLLEKLFALLDEGSLHPLPHRVFPVTRAGDAFRAMAQGKHTGKLVISMNPEAVPAAPRTEPPAPRFSADATYLIVGGFGGFGLTLAEWMLSRGARTLVLAGRSGATGEEARAALARLRETGARVEPLALDVADADAVDRALATLREDLPPLRGVFHTAMVLDDGILANLDRERFLRVTASKVRGAWNLHAACGLDLDHFVLFSSVSSVMGNQGQGNYAAANAFLDALAQYRRKVGLPGLSINWGHLSDVGYLARNHEVADMLDRRGIEGLRPAQAMEGLEVILSRNEPQILCARADWSRLAKVFSAVGSQRFLPLVSRYLAEEETGGDGGRIRKELARAAPEEREAIIQGYVREQVARVLGGDPANLDLERPLAELGLDSLMAVELKNRIEGDLGITLPTRDLMQEPTIEKLTPVVMSQLGVGGEVGAPVPGPGLNPGVPDLDEGMPEGLPTAPAAS